MKYIITLDTGTTNSRAFLWSASKEMIGHAERKVGVRNTAIDGNNACLKKGVKECLDTLLEMHNLTYSDIEMIIASGMITSNVGLVEIPHVVAPAGINELASNIKPVLIPDVCPVPIWFIRGIKNNISNPDLKNYEEMDIMRGEEVESIAVLNNYPRNQEYLLVLPGSHSKFISVDKSGRISGCLTTITGELLSSIVSDTIIADAVGRKFIEMDSYDKDMALEGYRCAKKVGIGRACFSGRILSLFAVKEKNKIGNFIFGAAFENDVCALQGTGAISLNSDVRVIISGKDVFCQVLFDILQYEKMFAQIDIFTPKMCGYPLSAEGAFLIADRYSSINGHGNK